MVDSVLMSTDEQMFFEKGGDEAGGYHQTVMASEVVDLLTQSGSKGGVFVDGTLGGGGHAEALLKSHSDIRILGMDQDAEAIQFASTRLKPFGDRFQAFRSNFCRIADVVKGEKVAGVILDLGVSSHQLNSPERGFSFQGDGPLDMRMSQETDLTAKTILNRWDESELAKIFWELGEERFSRQVARAIVERRIREPLETTKQLADLVTVVVRKRMGRMKIHPATRVFQALRMAVNRELEVLTEGLEAAWECLGDEGRMVVISFHSLEDRIVKNIFRKWVREQGAGRFLNKKPMEPGEAERMQNPRSRSAKLRGIEKIKNQ